MMQHLNYDAERPRTFGYPVGHGAGRAGWRVAVQARHLVPEQFFIKEMGMHSYLEDRLSISDLMIGWIHRDLGEWDRLRSLFHPDGIIEVTWFEGRFVDFVDASARMRKSDLRTKHFISEPVVTFNGDKAIAETNAVIVGENVVLGLGCNAHNRFYDLVERRNGVWKIVKRQSVYDMASFSFPLGPVALEADVVARYPREYAPLAYLLEKSGFPVRREFGTKGGAQEADMKEAGRAWLAG